MNREGDTLKPLETSEATYLTIDLTEQSRFSSRGTLVDAIISDTFGY